MSKQSVTFKNYVVFGVIMIVLTVGILSWLTYNRLVDYRQYHQAIAEESVAVVAEDVAHFITERNRLVNLFSQDHLELILQLVKDPENDDIRERLAQRIVLFFPDHFAFTIADNTGKPYYEDFDGLMSELCANDLKQFAQQQHYEPYVHPNSEGYHFDVMAPFGDNDISGVLFISFHVDILGNFIRASQNIGHNLMLIYPKVSDLIEVVAEGARNKWERNDYRLSDEEKTRILARKPVKNTRWEVVDQYQAGLFQKFASGLWIEAIVILIVITTVCIFMIQRIKRSEYQRSAAEVQRKIVEAQKDQIMGVISHELRSPISAIIGSLQMLSVDLYGQLDPEIKAMIDIANGSAKRLLVLVNDLLDADTLETGNLKFNLNRCELNGLVKSAIRFNQVFADRFNVKYQYIDSSMAVMVNCDENRIDQVITNLLTNAAKYGGENKSVEVEIKMLEKAVRVEVTDHGPGISDEFQSKVFERYTVEHSSRNDSIKSIGLGLHIAKKIVEKHGGVIGFNTQQGVGSTFYFELPVVENSTSH